MSQLVDQSMERPYRPGEADGVDGNIRALIRRPPLIFRVDVDRNAFQLNYLRESEGGGAIAPGS